jgi:hypothetical protein
VGVDRGREGFVVVGGGLPMSPRRRKKLHHRSTCNHVVRAAIAEVRVAAEPTEVPAWA